MSRSSRRTGRSGSALGTLACDLLLAVVVTSLLRARFGYRTWRAVHWLAYASWPLALVHSLGHGQRRAHRVAGGARARLRRRRRDGRPRARLGTATASSGRAWSPRSRPAGSRSRCSLWYRAGPAQQGWATRAGTPAALLTTGGTVAVAHRRAPALPAAFSGRLTGRLTQAGPDGNGLVTIRIDSAVRGGVKGKLRLALAGIPTDEGGVSMTSSGVAFAATGSPVYEGSVVGLDGTRVEAHVSATDGGSLDLVLDLRLDPTGGTVGGTVHGTRA